MTGREGPSEHALRSELYKRLYLLESGPGSRSGAPAAVQGSNFSKRHHRIGLAGAAATRNGTLGSGMGSNTTGTGNGTNTGVSALDIQAAINGGVTVAKPPTANDSLGLDIE